MADVSQIIEHITNILECYESNKMKLQLGIIAKWNF